MEQKGFFKPLKRVIIFIDGPNLYFGLNKCFKIPRVDIEELCKKLCGYKRELMEIRYYDSPFVNAVNPMLAKEQDRYLEELRLDKNIQVFLGNM